MIFGWKSAKFMIKYHFLADFLLKIIFKNSREKFWIEQVFKIKSVEQSCSLEPFFDKSNWLSFEHFLATFCFDHYRTNYGFYVFIISEIITNMKTSRCSVTCDNVTFLRNEKYKMFWMLWNASKMNVWWLKTIVRVVNAKNKIQDRWQKICFSTNPMIHSIFRRFHGRVL